MKRLVKWKKEPRPKLFNEEAAAEDEERVLLIAKPGTVGISTFPLLWAASLNACQQLQMQIYMPLSMPNVFDHLKLFSNWKHTADIYHFGSARYHI